jgi:hypothetical protein
VTAVVQGDSKKKINGYKQNLGVREEKKCGTGFEYGFLGIPVSFTAK